MTVTQAELDEFFQPRIVTFPTADAVVDVDPTNPTSFAPPEYSETNSTPPVVGAEN